MSGQDEEDTKHIADPSKSMQKVNSSGGVFGDEKVQEG